MVNALPKYVGSTTLAGELEWSATLLEGDLEAAIPKVKHEVDGELFMLGDRGTVRLNLDDVKRFGSGVVLLTYLPAS